MHTWPGHCNVRHKYRHLRCQMTGVSSPHDTHLLGKMYCARPNKQFPAIWVKCKFHNCALDRDVWRHLNRAGLFWLILTPVIFIHRCRFLLVADASSVISNKFGRRLSSRLLESTKYYGSSSNDWHFFVKNGNGTFITTSMMRIKRCAKNETKYHKKNRWGQKQSFMERWGKKLETTGRWWQKKMKMEGLKWLFSYFIFQIEGGRWGRRRQKPIMKIRRINQFFR